MAWFPPVHHTVNVVVEHLFLEGMEGLVQFGPGVAGGESRHENIGLVPFGGIGIGIGIDTGINSLQNVVCA